MMCSIWVGSNRTHEFENESAIQLTLNWGSSNSLISLFGAFESRGFGLGVRIEVVQILSEFESPNRLGVVFLGDFGDLELYKY